MKRLILLSAVAYCVVVLTAPTVGRTRSAVRHCRNCGQRLRDWEWPYCQPLCRVR